MNLYLIRHGETDFNLRGVYYGWTDCDINEKGKSQAKKLNSFFENIKIDRIISSTLLRAVTTADIIKGNHNIPYIKLEGIREMNFGSWEDRTFKDIEENDPDNCHAWWKNWKEAIIPEGETFMEFYERVSKQILEIIDNYGDENIIVVSHSGALSVMLCELIGIGSEGFWKFKAQQEAYTHISIVNGDIVVESINCSI